MHAAGAGGDARRPGDPGGGLPRPGDPRGGAARHEDPGEPEIVVLPDAAAVSRAAADRLAASARAAVARRGRADIATTGGSTPAGIYRALAAPPLRDQVPWERLHLWFGDDRFVPRGDPNSNLAPVDAVLLGGDGQGGSPLPPANVHPWPVAATIAAGGDAAACAAAYEVEMRAALTVDAAGRPALDAMLIGIGPDGHLLSVFPDSEAFDARGWALAVPAPDHVGPHIERVTWAPAVLDATPALLAVVLGATKASVLASVLCGLRDERALPAQRARRAGATWILDAAAASELPARVLTAAAPRTSEPPDAADPTAAATTNRTNV